MEAVEELIASSFPMKSFELLNAEKRREHGDYTVVLKALVDSSILTALSKSSFIGLKGKKCSYGSIRLLLVLLSHFKEEGQKHYMFNYLSKSLNLLSKHLASTGIPDHSSKRRPDTFAAERLYSFDCTMLIELLFDKSLEYGKGLILLDYVLLPLLRNLSLIDLELLLE